MAWRKPDEALVALLHQAMPDGPEPVEFKPMFGGPCYWVRGNMFAAVHQDGLFVRLAPHDREELLARPGAHLFEPVAGRPMKEYVVLPDDVLADPAAVGAWLARAMAYAGSLPPKTKQSRRRTSS